MKPHSFLFVIILTLVWPSDAVAADNAYFEELYVGGDVYTQVTVNKVTPTYLFITHSGGLSQVFLRDLSPKLQQRFGYDPAAERPKAPPPVAKPKQKPKPKPRENAAQYAAARQPSSSLLRAMQRFRAEPTILQDQIFHDDVKQYLREGDRFALVKSQGRRPSCSVFAVISALELQRARSTGRYVRLSEAYTLWAVRESLGMNSPITDALTLTDSTDDRTEDVGYTLGEVLFAVNAFGILEEEQMRYGLGANAREETPEKRLFKEAQANGKIVSYELRGTPETLADQIIHCCNERVPVTIGIAWPHWRSIRNGVLSKQTPDENSGHAVTIFGYKSSTGLKEDVRFYMKNSYGRHWGVNGFGWISYEYLVKNIGQAVVLEMH